MNKIILPAKDKKENAINRTFRLYKKQRDILETIKKESGYSKDMIVRLAIDSLGKDE